MILQNVSLSKCGDAYYLEIDDEMLNALNMESDKKEFKLEVKDNQIILTAENDLSESLETLFENYEGNPLCSEDKFAWGESVGRELKF